MCIRIGGALLCTLALASQAKALSPGGAPSFGDGCAPPPFRPPALSLLVDAADAGTLFLQTDPALVGGLAFLLIEDPQGPRLPGGLCTDGLRGRVSAAMTVRAEGRVRWDFPPEAAGLALQLRAIAWPKGQHWADAQVSNRISLPLGSAAGALSTNQELVITELQKDPTVVSDSQGEWLEITNPGSQPVDIEGWSLADLGTDQTLLDNGGAGIVVPAGGAIVLGRQADPAQNGGIPVDAVYSGMTLSNGDDEVLLIRPDGTIADMLAYDDGIEWPDEPGKALALDPASTTTAANDDGANWCSSAAVIGSGPDTGTPGAVNDSCGG